MRGRGLKVALVALLTMILLLGFAGVAFAQWPDLTLSILGDYGITEAEVAMISDGFPDGTWKPYNQMPRKQFVKMAVDAYKIPLVTPATATYIDVPTTHQYFAFIEAATAAGLTNGVGGGRFDPEGTITREQALAIIARFVADRNGFDLDTMFTQAEIDALLGQFGDASQVGPSLREEMAFAVDFGITLGDAFGNLVPKKNLTRIQGAAMLIRSLAIIPPDGEGPPAEPAEVVLISQDEQENLIGLTEQYTFQVNDENGDAIPFVLVDFDTLTDPWYVGNIQPEAALTNGDGQVTVNLISTEIGVQRVSAAAPGVAAVYATKYWVALDEVFFLDETLSARNNAGVTHTWEARVVVFGPGPLSTSRQDFYNAVLPGADNSPGAVNAPEDGQAVTLNNFIDELDIFDALGLVPRAMADIPVLATIVEGPGEIVAADFDGTIAADGQSAVVFTNAEGLISIDILSTEIGTTLLELIADYAGNPYPGMLVNRDIYVDGADEYWSVADWEPQPTETAVKQWIAHTIGGGEGPIDPSMILANIGEEFTLTITLEDTFGNPVEGRQVEWFMQGVGHFVTDDGNTITDPEDPAGNKDLDTTDAAGQARVMVKSLDPGEQIVHAKVRDKGVTGEGTFMTFDAEVQWFDVDVATFDDPSTAANEALSTNPVGSSHDFTLHVFGLKLELDPSVDNPKRQTPFIDTDAAGSSFDGIIDAKDAAFLGGIFLVNPNDPVLNTTIEVQGRNLFISDVGGITEFDFDRDGVKETFTGQTGIYLPLEGKTVTFANVDTLIDFDVDVPADLTLVQLKDFGFGPFIASVGSVSPATAVTDANGQAVVTVTSNLKGPQTVMATVDWPGNPHNGPELATAFAKKIWQAGVAGAAPAVNISILIDGIEVANNTVGEITEAVNPIVLEDGVLAQPGIDENGDMVNAGHIEVHVRDQFGNDLPDYEVVYLLENIGTLLPVGAAGTARTYLPLAFFDDLDELDLVDPDQPFLAFDQNGAAPDHDEPTPAEDPFGVIVGDGGTLAFYFNQWLGAGTPGTLSEQKNTFDGQGGARKGINAQRSLPFAAIIDPVTGLPLATDGAKAWTRDGFFIPGLLNGEFVTGQQVNGGLAVNMQTGSNVDVVLFEDPANPVMLNSAGGPANVDPVTQQVATHFKSIIKILVYAPADGLVVDQTPIFSQQVHKVWAEAVAAEVVLTPAFDVNVPGDFHTLTATVSDQLGNPVVGASVEFVAEALEGNVTDGVLEDVNTGSTVVLTNASGVATLTYTENDFGVQRIRAFVTDLQGNVLVSNAVIKDWAEEENMDFAGDDVILQAGDADHDGMSFNVRLGAFNGPIIGSGTYTDALGAVVDTTHNFVEDEEVWIQWLNSNNFDDISNYWFDIVDGDVIQL